MSDDQSLETEATELLRTLIRNACVNDGTPASGHEDRNCDAIEAYFAGSGLRCERYSAGPGRISLITRIEGSYSGIMGLPLFETVQLLRQAGLRVL